MAVKPAGEGYELCSADLAHEQPSPPADDGADPDTPEPYDPEHLNEVVATFIESSGGKVAVKEMVYALTLRRKVPKDLYKDIRQALRSSGIVRVQHPWYKLSEKEASRRRNPPTQRQPLSSPPRTHRQGKKPVKDGQEGLEAKMRGAFKTSYHPTPPRKRRREQR